MDPAHAETAHGPSAPQVAAAAPSLAGGRSGAHARLNVVLTTLSSDAHTWNLVFLQLLLEERGHRVTNLGACVPDDLLVAECVQGGPDLVVVSSVNGHGFRDGMRAITKLRRLPQVARTPIVIGGKLDVSGTTRRSVAEELRRAGFDAVFDDYTGLPAFLSLLASIQAVAPC